VSYFFLLGVLSQSDVMVFIMVKLTEISLYLPQLPDRLEGLRLVHFGDVHTRRCGPRERRLHEIVRQGCDLVLCSGDSCFQLCIANPMRDIKQDKKPPRPGLRWNGWVFAPRSDDAVTLFKRLLENHACSLGVYVVRGNHDSSDFIERVAQMGVRVLSNQAARIDLPNGGRFNLAGMLGYGRVTTDIPKTLLEVDPELFTIALCHYPEMAEALATAGVDLILAGHTHGGQICLPTGRAIVTHSCTGRKYTAGLERIGDSYLYTTRGMGQTAVPFRLFCPPEVVRITLHRGDFDRTVVRN